ncbi:hypothetical protein IFR04_008689 [Cadophora malorum]|uniref:Uncharacterized protein n=1 Tax=Cadophora malorum TaxID=108018 RepID=A0A8H7W9U9_9HELO|nr:hypothetical protein IFR04_008689 [Cadophora malorum]
MSTANVQFLHGINRHDVKSLRQVIRNTEQRIEITKGLGFNQREQVRQENEAARVFEEQASKNEIVRDLLERFIEAYKYPDGDLLKVTEWFVTAAEAASSFQPGTDLYQQAVTAYGKALDDHGSELCRTRSVIKWPRQSPVYMAKDILTMTPEASPTKNVQFVRGNNGRHTSHPPTSDFNYDIYDVPASPAAGQNPSRPSTRARKPGPRAGEKRRLPVSTPAVKNTAKPSRPIAAMRKSGRLGKATRVSYEEEESDDDIRKEKGDDPMGSRQHQVHLLLRVQRDIGMWPETSIDHPSDEEMLDVDGYEDYQSRYDEADDEQAIGDKGNTAATEIKQVAEVAKPAKTVLRQWHQSDDVEEYITPREYPNLAFKPSMIDKSPNRAGSRRSRRTPKFPLLGIVNSNIKLQGCPHIRSKAHCAIRSAKKKLASAKPVPAKFDQADSTETIPDYPNGKPYHVAGILAEGFHQSNKAIEWCYLEQWEDSMEGGKRIVWDNTWEPVKLMKNQVLATVEGFDKILDWEYLDGPMSYEQALAMMEAREQEKERKPKAAPAPRGRGRPRKNAKIYVEDEED